MTVNFVGALIVGEFVAQETQEGDDPGIAGHAVGEVSFRKVGQAVLEDAPEGAGIGEGGGNFVREVALWFQAEVGRFQAGHVGGDDLIEQLRPEQTAFNSDGRKRRHLDAERGDAEIHLRSVHCSGWLAMSVMCVGSSRS